jgi:hypothetical protein
MGLYTLATRTPPPAAAEGAAGGPPAPGAQDQGQAGRDQALDSLTKYIPTETITLFVAAMAASSSLQKAWPLLTPAVLYWTFAVLTPVLFILFKLSTAAKLKPDKGFWFDGIAGIIAYLIWALAVPKNPYTTAPEAAVAAAFGALFVSTILQRIEVIVKRPG